MKEGEGEGEGRVRSVWDGVGRPYRRGGGRNVWEKVSQWSWG